MFASHWHWIYSAVVTLLSTGLLLKGVVRVLWAKNVFEWHFHRPLWYLAGFTSLKKTESTVDWNRTRELFVAAGDRHQTAGVANKMAASQWAWLYRGTPPTQQIHSTARGMWDSELGQMSLMETRNKDKSHSCHLTTEDTSLPAYREEVRGQRSHQSDNRWTKRLFCPVCISTE